MIQRLNVCLLLVLSAGISRVSGSGFPLTGLSVSCHNFENVVSWNYSGLQPQPEFIVLIQRYIVSEKTVLKTTENYLDISNYTQNAEECYLVSVKTVNHSENFSAEISFTYKEDFPLEKKCTVDFPSVSTSAFKHGVEISFDHPLDIYEFPDQTDDQFIYSVKCNEIDCGRYECSDTCTAVIPVPESLYGLCFSLYFSGFVGFTPLKERSQEVCSTEPMTETNVVLVTGVVCAAVVLLVLVIVAGVAVHKKVTGFYSQRAFLKFLGMVPHSTEAQVNEPECPPVSAVRSISHSPLLIIPDDDEISTPTTLNPEEVTHLPLTNNTVVDLPELVEPRGGDEDEDDGAFASSFNDGYDCKKFPFEMSPGDVVEAYRQ